MNSSARPVPTPDLPVPTVYNPGPRQYYEQHGQLCDWIVRCEDCKTLVTTETIHEHGACHKCGGRKFREPRTLSIWEWFKIRVGLLDFPHRAEFLASFARSGAKRAS